MFDQLYQFLMENNLIHPGQSGFLKKKHSVLTCLLKITDDWYNEPDNGEMVGSVFIVDHDLFCKKLEHGVQQLALSWFQSYLSNRQQYCRVVERGRLIL